MTTTDRWKRLFESIDREGILTPLSELLICEYEKTHGISLPHSYREYCKIFGPGCLNAALAINIAVPGPKSDDRGSMDGFSLTSLEDFNESVFSTSLAEVDEYCAEPNLVKSGLFFGFDLNTHSYFWNPTDVTDASNSELGVYVVFREWKIHRLADSFESFIFDVCLERGIPNHGKLDYDPPLFQAIREI